MAQSHMGKLSKRGRKGMLPSCHLGGATQGPKRKEGDGETCWRWQRLVTKMEDSGGLQDTKSNQNKARERNEVLGGRAWAEAAHGLLERRKKDEEAGKASGGASNRPERGI